MTRITYDTDEKGFYIEAQGHTQYAQAGHDLVCAAVSTLMQTLLYRTAELTADYAYKVGSGYMMLSATGDGCMEAFLTIKTGLDALKDSYPKYISIVQRGCPIFKKNDVE